MSEIGSFGSFRDQIEALNDQPLWITRNRKLELIDIQGIKQGGCASCAYIPAVSYATAMQTMSEHGNHVLDYIRSHCGKVPRPVVDTTRSGLAVFYLSLAIELWCCQFDLDGVNWD